MSKKLPELFLTQSLCLPETAQLAFQEALDENPPISIRLNPHKKEGFVTKDLEPVPWCDDAYYLPERPVFTLDPLFQAGVYYVQEASSMLIETALKQVLNQFNRLKVLDMCAAPGGKTTLLASNLESDCLLVANEVIKSRVEVLKENLCKWGNANIIVTNHDSEDFSTLEGFFDLVLTDAPCSGEGLFRKDAAAIQEWSPENVQMCTARQKRILTNAVKLLKTDGILVYSTCTYNHFENEDNCQWLIENESMQIIPLAFPAEWGLTAKKYGYQCYPHQVKGEGFFVACFKKTSAINKQVTLPKNYQFLPELPKKQLPLVSQWIQNPLEFQFYLKPNNEIIAIPKSVLNDVLLVDKCLYKKSAGLTIGEIKGNDFIPSHELALSNIIQKNIKSVELDKNQALLYFKREEFSVDAASGWTLARYQGKNLGWMKVLKNRINNYLPKNWRIRMDINFDTLT